MALSETDKAFFSDGYNIGLRAAEAGLTKESIYSATKQIYDAIDGLIDSLLKHAHSEGISVDCKKGCYMCCYQPVFAVSHEIDFLYNFITFNLTKKKRIEILKRAQETNNRRKSLSKERLYNHKEACPLLEEGSCIAYEVRPMACRIYLSLSVDSCQKFYDTPSPDENYAKLLEFPLQAGRMMNEGFTHALKASQLNTSEFRIEEGLITMSKLKK
jgi:Fe-S-cluster containining protein